MLPAGTKPGSGDRKLHHPPDAGEDLTGKIVRRAMATASHHARCQTILTIARTLLGMTVVLVASVAFQIGAGAEPPDGIGLIPGNAAVTGFSGALTPPLIAPDVDPAEQTFIDPNGASLRVIDLQHMGGPPLA